MAVVAAAPVLVGVAVVIAAGGSPDDANLASAASTSTATTTITRRDLVEIDTEDGTLGYADLRSVVNRLPGTVTWLPAVGRVIRADRALYKVDGAPVILMDGRVPAYRPLGPATTDGADVRQLERSLRETGYDPERLMTINRAWDSATTAAAKRWQKAHGLTQSGTVEPGRIAFLPGARRIATISATVGGAAGGAGVPAGQEPSGPGASGVAPSAGLMTTTSTRRQVIVALDTTKSAQAKDSARVRVVLPSGKRAGGRISSVGKVATATSSKDEAAGSSATPTATIEVKIRLFSTETALDQAPVRVRFEQSRRKNVLAIPVTALLARPGSKFAVQLVEAGGARRVVPVRPGLYASGYVEIAGAGLRPGQRVTNAAVR